MPTRRKFFPLKVEQRKRLDTGQKPPSGLRVCDRLSSFVSLLLVRHTTFENQTFSNIFLTCSLRQQHFHSKFNASMRELMLKHICCTAQDNKSHNSRIACLASLLWNTHCGKCGFHVRKYQPDLPPSILIACHTCHCGLVWLKVTGITMLSALFVFVLNPPFVVLLIRGPSSSQENNQFCPPPIFFFDPSKFEQSTGWSNPVGLPCPLFFSDRIQRSMGIFASFWAWTSRDQGSYPSCSQLGPDGSPDFRILTK